MEYCNEYVCKHCGKKALETYAPSITVVGLCWDENGEPDLSSDGRQMMDIHTYYMTDICSDCYYDYERRYREGKEISDEEGRKISDEVCERFSDHHPDWEEPEGIAFVSSLYGSGAPSLFVFVKDPFLPKEEQKQKDKADKARWEERMKAAKEPAAKKEPAKKKAPAKPVATQKATGKKPTNKRFRLGGVNP